MLSGIIPAVVLPMNSSYEPELDEYKKYLKWAASSGITGVAVNVDTGEGPSLTRQERVEVIRATKEAAGNIKVIAGIVGSSTLTAVECARDAKEAGADAGLVFPNPAFLGEPLDPQLPFEYHRRISEDSGLDIILFQLQPALGGFKYTKEALERLTSLRRVVGIKEASFDAKVFLDTLNFFRSRAPNLSVLTGNDNFIFESFVLGADGALIGFGTPPAKQLVEMYSLVKKDRIKEAREIHMELTPLVEAIFSPPVRNYRARVKYALSELGIIDGKYTYVRPPLMGITQQEKDAIKLALKRIEV